MPTPRAKLGDELLNPSEFIASIELDAGQIYPVEIARVEMRDLQVVGKNQTKRKALIHFKGGFKPLVLNRTNEGTIARLHGTDARAWAGKLIALYRTTTKLGRDVVDCIRVCDEVPTRQQPKQAPAQDQTQTPGGRAYAAWLKKTGAENGKEAQANFSAWVNEMSATTGRPEPLSKSAPITADEADKLMMILEERP